MRQIGEEECQGSQTALRGQSIGLGLGLHVLLSKGPLQSLRMLRGPCISDFRDGKIKLSRVLGTLKHT